MSLCANNFDLELSTIYLNEVSSFTMNISSIDFTVFTYPIKLSLFFNRTNEFLSSNCTLQTLSKPYSLDSFCTLSQRSIEITLSENVIGSENGMIWVI